MIKICLVNKYHSRKQFWIRSVECNRQFLYADLTSYFFLRCGQFKFRQTLPPNECIPRELIKHNNSRCEL